MSMDGRRVPADHGRGTEERSKVDRAQTGRVVRRKLSNRHDATITVKSLGRVSAHNWRLADRNRCVDAVSWQPSSVASAGRPEEGSGGFSGIFEIVAADKAGVVGEKGDPFARRTSIDAPRWPFATLAARSTLAIPTCPRRRRGQGPMLDQFVGRLTTDGPVRVRHHVCIGAKRQATILVTAGGQGPGRSDHRSC